MFSALMREKPDVSVVLWMDRQPQIRYGLQSLPAGRWSARLMRELQDVLTEEIEERYASCDTAAAQQAASLLGARRQQGRPIEFRDTMIAAIVMSRHAIFATRNTAHFPDLGCNVVKSLEPLVGNW